MWEFKVKVLNAFNTNFAVGNLQLFVGKLQLPAPPQKNFFIDDAAEVWITKYRKVETSL